MQPITGICHSYTSSVKTISSARLRMLFMWRTHSIWSAALSASVTSSCLAISETMIAIRSLQAWSISARCRCSVPLVSRLACPSIQESALSDGYSAEFDFDFAPPVQQATGLIAFVSQLGTHFLYSVCQPVFSWHPASSCRKRLFHLGASFLAASCRLRPQRLALSPRQVSIASPRNRTYTSRCIRLPIYHSLSVIS